MGNATVTNRLEPCSILDEMVRLSQVSRLIEARLADAIDLAIREIESWMQRGEWGACDRLLLQANANQLHPSVSLAILSMTLVEKHRLYTCRSDFYRRVKERLVKD
jgi:hypothetical protein